MERIREREILLRVFCFALLSLAYAHLLETADYAHQGFTASFSILFRPGDTVHREYYLCVEFCFHYEERDIRCSNICYAFLNFIHAPGFWVDIDFPDTGLFAQFHATVRSKDSTFLWTIKTKVIYGGRRQAVTEQEGDQEFDSGP